MPTAIKLPFSPLLILDLDGPITWGWLEPRIRDCLEVGVSLCITYLTGVLNRGGYFFHLSQAAEGYAFSTFDRQNVLTFGTGEDCVAFMNHVSGRRYDENMWEKCQSVNLRKDEES